MQRTLFPIALITCLLMAPHFAFGACDLNATTSNFSAQLAAAQPGQTLCLASGNYGTFNGVTKSSPGVTITAASGAVPSMNIFFGNTPPVAWLVLDNITITGTSLFGGSISNVTIQNSHFTDKIEIWGQGPNNHCGSCVNLNNANLVFDKDLFDMSADQNGSGGSFEGRIQIADNGPNKEGVIIKNSKFTSGCADGIQISGNNSGYGVTIGPGNEFYNLLQGSCGPHIDSIQFVGTGAIGPVITGNYFHDNTTGIIGYDDANDATITDNVVKNIATDGTAIAGNATGTISHNTLLNNQLSCGVTHQGNVCRSAFINNIATGFYLNGGGAGAPSTIDYNVCTQGSCPSGYGTHNLTGTPTYIGGSNPTTYAGFQLSGTSLGHNAASDGTDIGMNTTTGTTTNPPTAPTNLVAAVQ